jgi:two-component system, OmpR family, phosphate regulon sensor histidine kinase PhoR
VKLGVRAKIFTVSLSLIVLSVLAGEIYLRHSVEANLIERIRRDLIGRLDLIRDASDETLKSDGALKNKDAWSELAHRIIRSGNGRLTFIRSDGVVLGDSEVDRGALDRLENHQDRPEVLEALRGSWGSSMRWSATVNRRLMYVAVPVQRNGELALIARLAVPLTEVDDALQGLRKIFGFGALIALAVALFLSFGAAHILSRSLRELTAAARKMSSGDLDVRTHLRGHDEVADLGRALDALAESLSANLSTMRAERDLLGRILESMQEGVLVMDDQRRILLVNPSLREMLNLSSEAVGRIAIEVIRNAELQRLLETALGSEGSDSGEIEIVGLKPRRALVHAKAMSGQPGLLAVFVDVTEVRRLESMRRDFVANVSHELRTPIAAVASAAETLRRSALRDPEASVRFVDMIERNARRLHELVEDVLDLSRIESKEFKPRGDAVDVGPIAAQVIGTFRERIEKKRLVVKAVVPAGTPPAIADHRAVEQVLTNLIENACKYCPEGSSITVRVSDEGAKVRVAVEDTGPGIEAKHLPRLFERFYRVDAGRTRDMGGTGLGLSIVKHLVESMGGMIGVQSTIGRGSTFWFTLPRDPRVTTTPPSQPHAAS